MLIISSPNQHAQHLQPIFCISIIKTDDKMKKSDLELSPFFYFNTLTVSNTKTKVKCIVNKTSF